MPRLELRAARKVNRTSRENPTGGTTVAKNKRKGVGKWPLHDKKMFQWYYTQTGAITESTIRAQAITTFPEVYEGSPLPRFSFTWMQKWRSRYSSYYTECISKASAETVASSRGMMQNGQNLTLLPRTLPTSAGTAITVAEPSDQLRAAKLSALLRNPATIDSATHLSSFVGIGDKAPNPPAFNLPNCDDESLPSTAVIEY